MSHPGYVPLQHIERLCHTGEPLPAFQNPAYAKYFAESWWDLSTDVTVGRRRTFEQWLASGALHTVMVDDTKVGSEKVQYYDSQPVLGCVVSEIMTGRSFTCQGETLDHQSATLGIFFRQGGGVNTLLGSTVSFDEIMEADIRESWSQLGVELCYRNAGESEYAFRMQPNFIGTLITTLRDME